MTKHDQSKESARETIARIKSGRSTHHSQTLTNSISGSSSITVRPRSRVSKSSQPVDTIDRKSALNNMAKKLLFGEISQGEALKELRVQLLGLKQDSYAKLVQVSRKTLSDIENNRGNYTTEVINKVFKPFGLKVGLIPVSTGLLNAIVKEPPNQ